MTEALEYKRAIVKLNGGHGALLCNRCWTIIKIGIEHEDVEHYCAGCRKVRADSGCNNSDQKQA
jgi:hypothetical protein